MPFVLSSQNYFLSLGAFLSVWKTCLKCIHCLALLAETCEDGDLECSSLPHLPGAWLSSEHLAGALWVFAEAVATLIILLYWVMWTLLQWGSAYGEVEKEQLDFRDCGAGQKLLGRLWCGQMAVRAVGGLPFSGQWCQPPTTQCSRPHVPPPSYVGTQARIWISSTPPSRQLPSTVGWILKYLYTWINDFYYINNTH